MYAKACALVCSYRCAFPELAPECILQELLARGPKWFKVWWLAASPFTRSGFIIDSGLSLTIPHLTQLTQMPNTAQLTDRLDEIIDSTWNDVVDLLKDYFVTNGGDLPCLHNDLDYGGDVAGLIDSAVPIYNAELSELAYFHHDAALSALVEQFGSADGDWPSGAFAAGLYCLIEQGVSSRWDDEAEDLWQEWLDLLDDKAVRQFALSGWTAAQPSTDTEPPTTPEA